MGMFLRRGPAPSRGTPIGSLDVGSIVKFNVAGSAREFLVVHQGLPSDIYDASCDGTWLLMKDCYVERVFSSDNSNKYGYGDISSYLNGDFLNLFDADIQGIIQQVKIPHKNGGNGSIYSGSNGLSVKIFLLAGIEIGFTTSVPSDGAKLDYFNASSSADSNRVAYLSGSANMYWTRSPTNSDKRLVIIVSTDGAESNMRAADSTGIRPAFILPSDFVLTDEMITTETLAA